MKISAQVLAHSKNEFGDELLSVICTMPRFILAELNTHRVFSRNSASSRAVPSATMINNLKSNPFIPVAWQKEHKGMQGTEYFEDYDFYKKQWLEPKDSAIEFSQSLSANGVTKQLCNRLLEPFMWHTVIITSSEWSNFFNLRCPQYVYLNEDGSTTIFKSRKEFMRHDTLQNTNKVPVTPNDLYWLTVNKGQAEIHMMALAEAIYDAKNESIPKVLGLNSWHIPFGDIIDEERLVKNLYELNGESFLINADILEQAKIEIATARCARVSYLNYEGKDDYVSDFKLFKKLKESGSSSSFHASPFEHCAKAMNRDDMESYLRMENGKTDLGWCRNFKGFIQLRAIIEE